MSFLFHIENRTKVFPKPEVLLLEPFKSIWERDNDSKKEKALKEFAFIELFTSRKRSNPYKDYPPDERRRILKETIIKNQKWKEDKLVEKAIKMLEKFQTEVSPTYQFYLTSLETMQKLDKFLKNIDLNKLNPKTGVPLYKPLEIQSAVIKTVDTIDTLKKLESRVHEELEDATSVLGNKMITYFNDPNNFKDL